MDGLIIQSSASGTKFPTKTLQQSFREVVWLALIENERTYISCDGFVYLRSKLSDEIVSNTYARWC